VIAANQDLLDRLRALPGVAGAGGSSNFPLRGGSGQENSLFVELHGEPMDPAHPLNSRQRSAGPGFFDAMGIKVVAGRDFSTEDRRGTTPVVIVNRAFARRYLTGKDPLKTQFSFGYPTIEPNTESSVIGIVEDVRMRSITIEAEPAFYAAQSQGPFRRYTMVVHSKVPDMTALRSAIRDEVRKTDPQMAVEF
jgi:hypothetical protein